MCLRAPVLREVRATWIIEMRGEGTKRPTGRFRGGCNCCDSVWKRKTVQMSGNMQSDKKKPPEYRQTSSSRCNLGTGCHIYTVPVSDRIACVSNISTCLWTNTPSPWTLPYLQAGFHLHVFLYAALFAQQHGRGGWRRLLRRPVCYRYVCWLYHMSGVV